MAESYSESAVIIYKNLDVPLIKEAESVTIGFFDGVHLGHQALLQALQKEKNKGKSALITFLNHPLSFFTKKSPPLIYPLSQKLSILEEYGIDFIFLLPFEKTLANTSYTTFLQKIHAVFPFKKLLLGKNSLFGKNREGNEAAVKAFVSSLKAESYYLDLAKNQEEIISSTKIRQEIAKKNFPLVEKLLGRKYSIWLEDWHFLQENRASFYASNLSLPPPGKYTCSKKAFSITISSEKNIEIYPFSEALSLPLEIFLKSL